MIKVEVVIPENDVVAINEELKKLGVGGVTVSKVKGRGRKIAPQIHASKGTEIFTPEFGDKYVIQVVVPDKKEHSVIEMVRKSSHFGKIFIYPVTRAVDIATGIENEQAI